MTCDARPFRLRGVLPSAPAEGAGSRRGVPPPATRPGSSDRRVSWEVACFAMATDTPRDLCVCRASVVLPSIRDPRCLPPCQEGTAEARQTQRNKPPQLHPVSAGALAAPFTRRKPVPRKAVWPLPDSGGLVSVTIAGASGSCRHGQRLAPGCDQGLRTPGLCRQSSRAACRAEFAPRLPIRQSHTSLGGRLPSRLFRRYPVSKYRAEQY